MLRAFYKFSFLFVLLFSFFLFAQITVSGAVHFRNKAVKDVNVILKGTYDGATTDENGNFSFITSETGNQIILFSHPKFVEIENQISIADKNIYKTVELKEKISEIDAVVISAGSIEASDKKRATALLTPIDIYTTAGADGQISSALNFLPGVQKVGESEGLFIRGGSGAESKIFIDGSLINNYFSQSVPGIAARDRFNTSLFKGNIFSSGGYSALYGQALSGILILESIDLPEKSAFNFGISPIFINGGFQQLTANKNASFGASLTYFNMGLAEKIFKYNTNFVKTPQGLGGDLNFRFKNKRGGYFKYYGSFDNNKMTVTSASLEPEFELNSVNLVSFNSSHNLSFRQKFGKYLLNVGSSYSYNTSDLEFSGINKKEETPLNFVDQGMNYLNLKTVLERKINKISAVRAGFELNNASEKSAFRNFDYHYKDLISSVFAETDLGLDNNFSIKLGVRAEHSSYLGKFNIAPRVAMAYKISPNWISSLAYGKFYQNPESKYLYFSKALDFQAADHYIFQVQRSSEGRSLRFESFYKNYKNLVKTAGGQHFQTAINNNGKGYGKGFEIFWRDRKTLKNIDYWITYSYLDSKRDYLNFPVSLKPNFASEHTLSAVVKKFVTEWKTGFNLSYTYAKGRPYYDIFSENGNNVIRHEGQLKDYNSLNFSLNYLPGLGKKDAKSFTVLVLSISNILGSKNVYGYQFSSDGFRSSAVIPPVNSFVFVGAFISFGVDRTEDAINSNL